MNPTNLSWRDRVQLVNSVLFCLVGIALIVRSSLRPVPSSATVLGVVFVLFGVYRISLAIREMWKRARSSK